MVVEKNFRIAEGFLTTTLSATYLPLVAKKRKGVQNPLMYSRICKKVNILELDSKKAGYSGCHEL